MNNASVRPLGVWTEGVGKLLMTGEALALDVAPICMNGMVTV